MDTQRKAQQISSAVGADNVYRGPVFSEVLPFYRAWEGLLPTIEQDAYSEINPFINRQLNQAKSGIYNSLAGTGGGRFGSAWGQVGEAQANAERDRRSQVLDWLNTKREGFKTLWYDPSERAFNRAIELGQTPNTPKAPTYEEYRRMMGLSTGGSTQPTQQQPGQTPYTNPGNLIPGNIREMYPTMPRTTGSYGPVKTTQDASLNRNLTPDFGKNMMQSDPMAKWSNMFK